MDTVKIPIGDESVKAIMGEIERLTKWDIQHLIDLLYQHKLDPNRENLEKLAVSISVKIIQGLNVGK